MQESTSVLRSACLSVTSIEGPCQNMTSLKIYGNAYKIISGRFSQKITGSKNSPKILQSKILTASSLTYQSTCRLGRKPSRISQVTVWCTKMLI